MKLGPASELGDYPVAAADRTRWIIQHRQGWTSRRDQLPLDRPGGWLLEEEFRADGKRVTVLTIFLTNRECPWRCLMCDLWQHATRRTVPLGAIPAQMDYALRETSNRPAQHLKLYNAGSFFDAGAIPPADHPAIAERCRRFERVVVECHPRLVGPRVIQFRNLLAESRLEVAMGLETIHPDTLARLNKRMTAEDFARAAETLVAAGIAVRAFVLVQPPFLDEAAALEWACRSTEFAFACGVETVSLIPTRGGNGALEALASSGHFQPPRLAVLEAALAHGLKLRRGRVFADLWELDRWAAHEPDFEARKQRLADMNLRQTA